MVDTKHNKICLMANISVNSVLIVMYHKKALNLPSIAKLDISLISTDFNWSLSLTNTSLPSANSSAYLLKMFV